MSDSVKCSVLISYPLLLSEVAEQNIYTNLLKLSPGLEERLNMGTAEDIHYVADMVEIIPPLKYNS